MATDWNKWFGREHPPALQKEWVLRSTWTDCPLEIQEIIEDLWNLRGLGNDNFVFKCTIENLHELEADGATCERYDDTKGWIDTPLVVGPLVEYLTALGVEPKDNVMIHHWW